MKYIAFYQIYIALINNDPLLSLGANNASLRLKSFDLGLIFTFLNRLAGLGNCCFIIFGLSCFVIVVGRAIRSVDLLFTLFSHLRCLFWFAWFGFLDGTTLRIYDTIASLYQLPALNSIYYLMSYFDHI
jgi:hypothetical protein